MSAIAMINGVIVRPPETRKTKSGASYSFAMVRVWAGADSQWWRVLAFLVSERATIDQLRVGDAMAASGQMRAEIHDADDGKGPSIRLSLIADSILPLKAGLIATGPKAESRA